MDDPPEGWAARIAALPADEIAGFVWGFTCTGREMPEEARQALARRKAEIAKRETKHGART